MSQQKNDHKKLKSMAVLWLIALAPLMGLVPMIPGAAATQTQDITIDETISNSINSAQSVQRKMIFDTANHRWFFFFNNGTNYLEKSTTNLVSFSSASAVFSDISPISQQVGTMDVHLYGSSSVYACTTKAYTTSPTDFYQEIWFANGTISGASISWNSSVRVYQSHRAISNYFSPICTVDTEDGSTFWVGIDDVSTYYTKNVFRSTDGGKTWADSLADKNRVDGGLVLALSGGKAMYIISWQVASASESILSYYYSAGWGAVVLANADTIPKTSYGRGISGVEDPINGDRVHLVFINSTGYIKYIIYNSGWGSAETVATPAYTEVSDFDGTSFPVLSVDTSDDSTVVGWAVNNTIYKRVRSSSGVWGDITEVADETAANMPRERDLTGSQTNMGGKILYTYLTGSGVPYNLTLSWALQDVPEPITPSGVLELSGLKCGDIWVTPDKTYLTVTATIQAQTAIQNVSVRFNDSLNVIQADYDNTTARWNLSQGRDYASLNPQATATSYYSASPDNYTLQVEFMFLANEQILDKNDVEVQYEYALQNGSVTTWVTNATMNIYNKGGATEYWTQNNAGFLPGGDVYSVYAKNTSSIGVNQTWVRLQHLHANFAVRLVLNSTNSGEDNLWQDFAHKGANEYYTNSTDWTIYYKIWYYDEQNNQWVQGWILSFVKQQGDIGSADEWTELNVTFYNGPNSEKTSSQNMSAWVEREPEARVRLWLDLWFNKINASSVHGARLNPMYFGIHYTGWALWGTGIAGQWEPMYKNETQAAAFDRLQDANGVENVTSPMLTCMKTEQILVMNDNTYALEGLSPLHYNYTLQIDNWDILEPKLSPTRNMEGVNTPLIVEPLLPDKTASSFWAPIYAALASIGGWIFKAFSALAEIVWQAVRAQFPWFAEWVDNINAALANGIEIANEMLSGIVEILKMLGGQVWIFSFITDFIRETWEFIYPMLAPFTQNSTVWLTLLIIIFGILPIADNLSIGRWDLVKNDLEMIWGFMRTIIIGIYVIVTTVVGWIISAIPL